MAWDIQLDPETGDFVFNGARDLSPVVGSAILRQRISNRLKIDYGSFVYEPTLGSRLRSILGSGVSRTERNIRALIMDALEPMTDILVTDVSISFPDTRTIQATIIYQSNDNAYPFSPVMTPESQATVLLPG